MAEAIFAFYSKLESDSPQRYIPRKPHQNGLLNYYAAGKMENELPDASRNDPMNPRTALLQIMARFPIHVRPHITVDAAFCVDDTLTVLHHTNALVTDSFNKH